MSTIPPSPLMALIALVTGPALAGPVADASAGASEIDTVQVVGSTLRKAESPKYTEPVLDTPQTITVVAR